MNPYVLWTEENAHESSFLALKTRLISRLLFVLNYNDQLFTSRSPCTPDINRCQVVSVLIFSTSYSPAISTYI